MVAEKYVLLAQTYAGMHTETPSSPAPTYMEMIKHPGGALA